MNIAEALTLLAQRTEYEQQYALTIEGFLAREDGVAVRMKRKHGATMTFETTRELHAFCDGLNSAATVEQAISQTQTITFPS